MLAVEDKENAILDKQLSGVKVIAAATTAELYETKIQERMREFPQRLDEQNNIKLELMAEVICIQ